MVMASRSSVGGGSGSGSGSGRTRVGRYELGRTLGEGTFAKVKFARNLETRENVAIKILDKEKVLKHKMIGQIKREISTMKLIRHPNVIRMYEVMASKTKIYIVMEFVTGGELFDKIAARGRLKEDEARTYFHQLINAVDYCHSRGVYHRDLKPENLLLDASGILKVSDFGLSALPQQVREDGLLHTTCGTPNYVAPEVINNKGYDGAKADLWSCGVILFVLMAGYLPFEESNLATLYKKIFKAEFTCPPWFSSSAKKLINRILDPNPATRITIAEILDNDWFKKGYKLPVFEHEDVNHDDVDAIFNELTDSPNLVVERREERPHAPVTMNAFELISTSQGLNLSSLFEKQMGLVKRETRFTSKCPANEIITKIEEAAVPMGFNVKKNNYKMKLQGEKSGRKGHLSVATEILEVAPSLHMVELRKTGGDTLEFHKFYKNLSTGLKDIVWKIGDEAKDESSDANKFSPDCQVSLQESDRRERTCSQKEKKTRTRLHCPSTPRWRPRTMPAAVASAFSSSMCFSCHKPAAGAEQQSNFVTTKPEFGQSHSQTPSLIQNLSPTVTPPTAAMASHLFPTTRVALSTNPILTSSSSSIKPSLSSSFLSPLVSGSVSGDFSGQRIRPASLNPSSSTSRGRRGVVTMVIPFSRGSAWEQPPPDLASYLYKNRIVYLGMSLVPSVTELILAEFLYLQYEDEEKPIYLYINSTGTTKGGEKLGYETEAFAIYDVMRYVKPPIFTLCVGNAWGEAALLLAAGAKGNRSSLPSSTIMIKQPIARFQGQATDVELMRKEVRNVKAELVKLYAKHIGKSPEEIEADIRRPKYFSPSEAVEYGIIDKVLYNERGSEDRGLMSDLKKAQLI